MIPVDTFRRPGEGPHVPTPKQMLWTAGISLVVLMAVEKYRAKAGRA